MISVSNVSKKYGEKLILDNLDLEILPGQIYGLIGKNGAGKTTLMKIISGLIQPNEGRISCFEKSSLDGSEYSKLIGYIPQENALYNKLTIYDNLLFWGGLYGLSTNIIKERSKKILSVYKLWDRRNDSVASLSGGMKKIISIVCSILHQPKILICDEPTVGVDPKQREHIYDLLLGLKEKDCTIIYSSHYLEEIEKICDRIGFVYHGKIVMDNTIEQLKSKYKDKKTLLLSVDSYVNGNLFEDNRISVQDNNIIFESINVNKELTTFLDFIQSKSMNITKFEIQFPSLEMVFLNQVS